MTRKLSRAPGIGACLGAIVALSVCLDSGIVEAGAPPSGESAAAAGSADEDAVPAGVGNARRGRLLFLQCRSCHSVEQGGINKVGPNLYGLLGAEAGKVEGFAYSDALTAAGVVWTPETLDAWLAAPSDFVPGNRMSFSGVSDPRDRADLIAYLVEATAKSEPE